ncbi:MAG: hypothetical protein R3C53_01250 [Pirellulaceae bacterium]
MKRLIFRNTLVATGLAATGLALVAALGCTGKKNGGAAGGGDGGSSAGAAAPTFSLAWSEYPSWSVFGVAEQEGLLDGTEGGMGEIEERWNVDIVLNLADYDTCIGQYASNTADAVCITNMDILAPSVSRPAVCILPTSTSDGADACITVGIENLDGLAGVSTHGLEKSVSQYCFERVLEINGKVPADYPFVNMDPGTAATAMQTGNADIQSIMVWNPFVMQTLRKREGSKALFDSTAIPEEIIDMVAIGKDSLARDGGDRFAKAVLDAFYSVNQLIDAADTRDKTLVALGAKFSQLELADMQEVVKQTRFYNTPAKGLALLEDKKFQAETMPAVAEFLVTHDMASSKPSFGFNQPDAQLNFTTQFISEMVESSGSGAAQP